MPDEATPTRLSLFDRISEVSLAVRYVIVAVGTAVFMLSAWLSFQRNMDFAWTSIRLAPAFALTHGYALFSAPETPPWVMVGYGPLYPVAYLPSTFASKPAPAVAIATVLAHLYILVPVGLLCELCARCLRAAGERARLHWSILLLLFALLACAAPSLSYVMTNVHVDAPALGLFLFASYAVLRADADAVKRQRWLLVAGVAAGLSAACKVNLSAAAVGFLIWVAWCFGLRAGVRFVVATIGAFTLVYAWVIMRDGFAAVSLNLRLPGRMPWFTLEAIDALKPSGTSYDVVDKVRTVVTLLADYARHYGIVAFAVLLLLLTLDRTSNPASRMATLFLVLTLVMLLPSIASVGKSGGDVNSRALVTLPLAMAALVAFATAIQQGSRSLLPTAYGALAAAAFVVAISSATAFLRWSIKGSSTLAEAH
ncbi:MAG TPA: hypothetical protein VK993_07075, partial [Chthoniobacterales bacterium]|nr:hypothetical protein [Chthoniobacterales bacterium]